MTMKLKKKHLSFNLASSASSSRSFSLRTKYPQPARERTVCPTLKGISEYTFPLDGEHIYVPVDTGSSVETFHGRNYYHNI